MGRHVIGTLAHMLEYRISIWNQSIKETLEVTTDLWVGVFLDEQ
jgi:hypothetical protein